jgi:hypothetical protein
VLILHCGYCAQAFPQQQRPGDGQAEWSRMFSYAPNATNGAWQMQQASGACVPTCTYYCRTAVFSCWTAGHEATKGAAGLQTLAGVKYRSGSAGRLLAVWGSGLAGGCGDVMVTRASERE